MGIFQSKFSVNLLPLNRCNSPDYWNIRTTVTEVLRNLLGNISTISGKLLMRAVRFYNVNHIYDEIMNVNIHHLFNFCLEGKFIFFYLLLS